MFKAQTGGFRMLPSYYEAIGMLPDKERLEVYDAIMALGFGNEPGELSAVGNCIFTLIEPTLRKSIRYFEAKQENGSRPKPKRNGTESETEAKRSEREAKRSETEAKGKRDSDSDSDSEGDSEGEREKTRSTRFVPPTAEELAAYCRERGSRVDPTQFADYYTARGWRVGSGLMRDWRAAVRTWERRGAQYGCAEGVFTGPGSKNAARDFGIRFDNADGG